MFTRPAFAVAIAFALFTPQAKAADTKPAPTAERPTFRAKDVIRLSYGATYIDLDGDGHKDMIVRYRSSDMGMVGLLSDTYLFLQFIPSRVAYRNTQGLPYKSPWRIIDLVAKPGSNDLHRIEWGTLPDSECVRKDIRVVNRSATGQPPIVLHAEAGHGENRYDPDWVMFHLYESVDMHQAHAERFADLDITDEPPRSGYQLLQSWQSKRKYCDVGKAFAREVFVR